MLLNNYVHFLGQKSESSNQDIQYTTRQGTFFLGEYYYQAYNKWGSVPERIQLCLRIIDITERKQQEEVKLQRYSAQESISAREKVFYPKLATKIRTPPECCTGHDSSNATKQPSGRSEEDATDP